MISAAKNLDRQKPPPELAGGGVAGEVDVPLAVVAAGGTILQDVRAPVNKHTRTKWIAARAGDCSAGHWCDAAGGDASGVRATAQCASAVPTTHT